MIYVNDNVKLFFFHVVEYNIPFHAMGYARLPKVSFPNKLITLSTVHDVVVVVVFFVK